MSNRIIDSLNNRMPQKLNKTTEPYTSLFGRSVYTENSPVLQSSDINCGAIVNELEFVKLFVQAMIGSFTVDGAEDTILEKFISLFLSIVRIYNEEDSELRNRFKAYMLRDGNTRWRTAWSLRDIFSYFFNKDDIYIDENYVETNLVLNPGFETATGDDFDNWTEAAVGASTVTKETDPFQNQYSAQLNIDSSNSSASLSQTLTSVVAGDYKIGFWYKDDGNCPTNTPVKLSVQRSGDSYYYNFATNTWQAGVVYKLFTASTTWTQGIAYVNNESTYDLTVMIQNDGGVGVAYAVTLDRVEFGVWQIYPSIKLIIAFAAVSSGVDIALWGGIIDNLIDRGECEDATAPMISGETVPVLSNATWARDATLFYFGIYSYLFTKTIAAGTASTVDLVDDNSTANLHGLVAETTYTLAIRLYIPSGGIDYSEIKLQIHDYVAGWDIAEQIAANTYDAWQYVYVTKTLRASTTGIILRLEAGSTADVGETFYVDDIRLFEGSNADIAQASFFDQDFIAGEGGGYTSDFFLSLLDRARSSGVKGTIETIVRS